MSRFGNCAALATPWSSPRRLGPAPRTCREGGPRASSGLPRRSKRRGAGKLKPLALSCHGHSHLSIANRELPNDGAWAWLDAEGGLSRSIWVVLFCFYFSFFLFSYLFSWGFGLFGAHKRRSYLLWVVFRQSEFLPTSAWTAMKTRFIF